MNYPSIFIGFFGWWYSGGLKDNIKFLGALFGYITNLFSVGELTRTFFTPWRRIQGPRRRGIEGFSDWLVDNLVSRSVGILLRLTLIFVYLLVVIGYFLFGILAVLSWIFMPMLLLLAIVNLSGVLL